MTTGGLITTGGVITMGGAITPGGAMTIGGFGAAGGAVATRIFTGVSRGTRVPGAGDCLITVPGRASDSRWRS